MEKKMMNRVLTKLKRDGLLALCISIVRYPFQFIKRKSYQKMLALGNPKDKFSEIYKNNLWSSSESLSGEGSEVAYTEPLRKWLVSNILNLKVKDFVDAPCGDYNWMKLVTPKVDINYIGLDIVGSVISKNKLEYGSPKVDFRIANICEDVLPACDILMVRDCLFHLSNDDINNFLNNLARTDYKYLLTTTHKVEREFKNLNIITGDFRIIDLFSEPFNFDPKLVSDRVNDYPIGYPTKREMILVEKQFVPTSLSRTKLDSLN
jgi:hypothetical protein